eukprot:jgi/Bigna1/147350/aug1.142_g22058
MILASSLVFLSLMRQWSLELFPEGAGVFTFISGSGAAAAQQLTDADDCDFKHHAVPIAGAMNFTSCMGTIQCLDISCCTAGVWDGARARAARNKLGLVQDGMLGLSQGDQIGLGGF